jgi:hypothetical protein
VERRHVVVQVCHGVNSTLLLVSSGAGGGTSELSVFVSAVSPVRFWFSAFSPTTTSTRYPCDGRLAGGLGLTEVTQRTSKGIHQPHQPSIYKLMGIQGSYQPIKNLSIIRTSDSRGRCSRRRAVPGTGIAVVDDGCARTSAIRSTIMRV